jgi:hypothetical protein
MLSIVLFMLIVILAPTFLLSIGRFLMWSVIATMYLISRWWFWVILFFVLVVVSSPYQTTPVRVQATQGQEVQQQPKQYEKPMYSDGHDGSTDDPGADALGELQAGYDVLLNTPLWATKEQKDQALLNSLKRR